MNNKYKIIVKATSIIINDYTFGDCEKLEKSFSIYNQVTHTSNIEQIEYDQNNKTLIIPKGVDIDYIEKLFNVKAYIDNNHDIIRYNLEPTLIKYLPRNEKQEEAMQFLLGQNKYYYTSKYNQLMIALNTGEGKTYLGVAYTAYMNMKTIIITASVNWLEQWEKRIIEYTNILHREICFIKGTATINNLFRKPINEVDRYKVYLITHATILNYANTNGWDKVGELFNHLGIGVKIFDEAHLNFDNMVCIDYHTNTFRTLYLSATPARGDEGENKIFNLYFKNVPRIELFNPDEDPRTNYIAIRYNSGLTAQEISKCVNRYGFNKMTYCDQVVLKENFDYLMRIVMNLISAVPGKKLLFLATNKAVQILYEWIESNYPEYHNCVGIFTSLNPNKVKALEYPIILTTSKSAGAAVDIKGLTCSIQLAEPTKSEPQNRQRLGRTRGYNTFYIDIIDDDCAITRSYYINNLPMFETYAMSIKELRIKSKELKAQAFKIMKDRMEKGISPFIKL